MPFSSHHVKCTYCQHGLSLLTLNLITWLRQCFSDLPTGNFLFSPPFVLRPLWEALKLTERSYTPRVRVGRLHKLFGNSSAWVICLFYFPTYLFNHLSISVWTHGYLFYILGYNPILLYFPAPLSH